MPVQLTIRNVPESVRDRLAARAAGSRRSMQEYLLGELERLAATPTTEEWLEEVRERKQAYQVRLGAEEIVAAVDEDRR